MWMTPLLVQQALMPKCCRALSNTLCLDLVRNSFITMLEPFKRPFAFHTVILSVVLGSAFLVPQLGSLVHVVAHHYQTPTDDWAGGGLLCEKVEGPVLILTAALSANIQQEWHIRSASPTYKKINAKFGGANHDAFIWENSVNNYIQSLHRSDFAYPQRPWMMTPYAESSNPIAEMYNKKHSATRVVIENTFGRLKNRWRCVCKDRVLHYKPAKCAVIIIACCILHNIATDYNIPDPEDSEGDTALTNTSVNDPVQEHETSNDLLMGRAVRDQLARRISGINISMA
ncbi:hypothetical protein SFRURICE_006463 [Spodoptera frugiperda]|nr:hypothetical protein SFRURICE_006463 [Spodoptera frugiperda]